MVGSHIQIDRRISKTRLLPRLPIILLATGRVRAMVIADLCSNLRQKRLRMGLKLVKDPGLLLAEWACIARRRRWREALHCGGAFLKLRVKAAIICLQSFHLA